MPFKVTLHDVPGTTSSRDRDAASGDDAPDSDYHTLDEVSHQRARKLRHLSGRGHTERPHTNRRTGRLYNCGSGFAPEVTGFPLLPVPVMEFWFTTLGVCFKAEMLLQRCLCMCVFVWCVLKDCPVSPIPYFVGSLRGG